MVYLWDCQPISWIYLWKTSLTHISLVWQATLICAIRLPHTNLLTIHTILICFNHSNMIHQIFFPMAAVWKNKRIHKFIQIGLNPS